MPVYNAPIRDINFLLNDVLQLNQQDIPGYNALEPELLQAILEEGGKLASEVLAPLNASGDREGCRLENGVVRTPKGFKEAFVKVKKGGWTGLDCDPNFGGQGLPYIVATVIAEIFASANMAFGMYPGLTHGAYSAIHTHGSADQKATYLPQMVSCEWTGTMNLTEPQCGTDLGLMRTKAEPKQDGSYAITGQKIFISAGDHDLAQNIIHLVLAKIPGGPAGVKGISLFIVPKFLVQEEGKLGPRNKVSVGKIEEKMGIHANATCVMNFDGAKGFLLGQAHKGMRAMFTMMNEARLGVGVQGYAQAEIAYQNALAYATARLQGRAVTGPENPNDAADPLIVHPDIRRNLMQQKSFVEGARAFTYWAAMLIDKSNLAGDERAHGLVSLLTPVIKGFLTDRGFEFCVQAQQVLGGHGYIEEWGMSQFARDARVAMIYEGANGIQALDLVGRKLTQEGGKHALVFFELIKTFCAESAIESPEFKTDFLEPLKTSSKQLQEAAIFFMQNGYKSPNTALAGSYDFMHLFGHVCLGYSWARMAQQAFRNLALGTGDEDFNETKIKTGLYYMQRELPITALHLARIKSGADPVMALTADQF